MGENPGLPTSVTSSNIDEHPRGIFRRFFPVVVRNRARAGAILGQFRPLFFGGGTFFGTGDQRGFESVATLLNIVRRGRTSVELL